MGFGNTVSGTFFFFNTLAKEDDNQDLIKICVQRLSRGKNNQFTRLRENIYSVERIFRNAYYSEGSSRIMLVSLSECLSPSILFSLNLHAVLPISRQIL